MGAQGLVRFLTCIGLSAASHFRYGTIFWVPQGGNDVEFTFLTAWRRSYWPGQGLGNDQYVTSGETFEVPSGGKGNLWYYGDINGPELKVTVTRPASVNEMDYMLDNALGKSFLSHTYPGPTDDVTGQPWIAGYTGCCRLDANSVGDPAGTQNNGLNNNGGRQWDVRTKVDLSGGPLAVQKDRSPTAVGGKPILRLRWDTVEKFDIVVIDPDDDPLYWRLGNAQEMGSLDPPNKQPGWGDNLRREDPPYNGEPMTEANKLTIIDKIVINKRGEKVRFGEATWDTTGVNTGYWQSTIMISSRNADIPYDFLLMVKDPKGNDPPVWDDGPNALTPAPEDSLEVVCPSGMLQYTLKALDNQSDPTMGDQITLYLINDAPSGMVHGPPQGLGENGFKNPVQQVITWSPGCFQKGKHVLCYQASDTNSVQQLDSRVRCVIILVNELTNKAPKFCGDGTPENGEQIPVCVGKLVSFTVEACDDNIDDVVSIKFRSGVPTGSVITPEIVPSAYPNWSINKKKNRVKRTFNLDPQQSLEDGDICFEGVDQPPTGGVTSTSLKTPLRCVRLTVRYPPRFIAPTPRGDEGETFRFVAKVCHETTFDVKADDKNRDVDEEVTIFVMEDPGIPNGAVVEPDVCPEPAMLEGVLQPVRCNPVSRTFRWSPTDDQVGKTYKICFIARDNKENCQAGGYFSQTQTNPCVEISVQSPEPNWSGDTPEDGHVFIANVGCTHTHSAQCSDAPKEQAGYDMRVSTVGAIPAGAHTESCHARAGLPEPAADDGGSYGASYGSYGGSYGASYGSYYRRRAVQQEAEDYSDYSDPADSTGSEYSEYSDAAVSTGLDNSYSDAEHVDGVLSTCRMDFTWKPSRGQEGHDYFVCYACSDVGCSATPMARSSTRCVMIHVERCRYCVQDGDTLHSINKYYHLDSNWLRLWNSNGNTGLDNQPVNDPDLILSEEQILNIGPVYTVQSGDTMIALAARFHTTVKKLLSVNPDMATGSDYSYSTADPEHVDIDAGRELCIMPCTDTPAVHSHSYKYAY